MDLISFILPLIIPITFLLKYKNQIEKKLKFLFLAYVLNLGLGKLLSPLAYIPLYLDIHISNGAPVIQIILMVIYLICSLGLIKTLYNQFISVKNV